MLVFFAMLGNADDWMEMGVFGREHEDFLRNYLELPNGIPSHDTIQRVFANSEFLQKYVVLIVKHIHAFVVNPFSIIGNDSAFDYFISYFSVF